ncbi:FecR family protein [Hyphomonas pacifica]|uniref:FecR protein domain-containing protein n=1 Tax=Hyphomonas pacifica TaxID=1280941 RepID=A0A062TXN7_9PROT|nr:FecR domain-containing protein [Hyphomonas pacifica]KCZ50792.1 hypothetical protein HY2_02755 [Hyphomonas pacifica]RAN34497.1 hypothetical protein HY3_11025 [Hyphomonas pacifica]
MKQKDVLSSTAPDLTAEAAAWLAQLETGKLSNEDMAAFREWIQRSPRHYAEIRRLAGVSLETNVLASMAEPLQAAAGNRQDLRRTDKSYRSRSFGVPLGVAGMLVATALAVAFYIRQPDVSPSPQDPIYAATEVGQTQEIALQDGSRINLNTDSKIDVAFVKAERSVYLEKGEAFFDVAHDPDRPFTVYAGTHSVTAIGTAFSVRWTDDELIVTVSEGKVVYDDGSPEKAAEGLRAVAREAAQPAAQKTFLAAGERLEISPASQQETVQQLPDQMLSRQLAWRSGFLDFEDAQLRDVVREMQRYTSKRIEIADEDLADLRFGGVFRIGETDAFFEALQLSFGVQVREAEDGHLILTSAK